jgi:hypothetical protein
MPMEAKAAEDRAAALLMGCQWRQEGIRRCRRGGAEVGKEAAGAGKGKAFSGKLRLGSIWVGYFWKQEWWRAIPLSERQGTRRELFKGHMHKGIYALHMKAEAAVGIGPYDLPQ